MMAIILLLTFVQVFAELKICNRKGAAWQRKLFQMNRKSPIFGFGLSIALSIGTGLAFGAAGMYVLASGLASTVITQVWYSMEEQLFNDINKRMSEVNDWFVANRDRWYKNLVLTLRTIRFLFQLCMLPFRLIFFVIDLFNKQADIRDYPKIRL